MLCLLIIKNTQQLFLERSLLSHSYFICREMIDLTLFQGLETRCAACKPGHTEILTII